MKNILVTGGAGFIGSNYVYYMLEKHPDYRIVCIDNLTYAGNLETLGKAMENEKFRFVKGDITDRKAVYSLFEEEGFSAVVIEALRCVTKLSENEPYDKFIARVKENPLAVAVKLNDLSDNMDIRRLPYISDKDVKRLKKYLKAYKQLTGTSTYSVFACRQEFPNAYKPWTEEDDLELTQMWCEGATTKELAAHFQRKPSAITSRIKKLELVEKYGER